MNNSRRGFFKVCGSFFSVALLSSLARGEERRRARGGADAKGAAASGPLANPLVDSKDPAAVAMNYVEKHGDLKKAELKTERQGVAFDKQFCNNCSFYKEVGSKNGSQVGTCQLFANKLVKSEGWCSSWNKKA
jgi:hypothetical protein